MAELDRTRDERDQYSSADGQAGSTTRTARPSVELNQSSSADGRAGSNTRPARPSAELDQSISADGRAGSAKRPARLSAELSSPVRRMAELDRSRDQLGIRRSGSVQFGGWPS
ncbi:hypothetical protein Bca101_036853 [Brassica carinata]